MDPEEFGKIVEEEFAKIPPEWLSRMKNVVLLVEDEPDRATRREEGLGRAQTLLGLYRGVPVSVRGVDYGVSPTVPDSITLYRLPISEAAGRPDRVRKIVRDTLWHEIAHHFGFSEAEVRRREKEASNRFKSKK